MTITPKARNRKETEVTNKEIIQELYQNFASGDVPAVVARFDNNISWTEADGFPLAGTYVGPEAVVENVLPRGLSSAVCAFPSAPRRPCAALVVAPLSVPMIVLRCIDAALAGECYPHNRAWV